MRLDLIPDAAHAGKGVQLAQLFQSTETAAVNDFEWTPFKDMTLTEFGFNFFAVCVAFSLVPLLLMIIYKSERKQAQFQQLTRQLADDLVVVGNNDTTEESNFKLVQTWGKLETAMPLSDEVFGLEVNNALRLSRKVEMYQYCKKNTEDDDAGSDSEEKEDQIVDTNYILKFSHLPIVNEPSDALRQNPESFPIKSQHKIVRKAHLKNFELNQEQCAKLGRF